MLSLLLTGLYLVSLLYALLSFSRLEDGKKYEGKLHDELPPVTVIVPTRDEEANIRMCLDSLKALDYPDYEVIVVDGGSKDRTREIVRKEFPDVLLLDEPPRPEGWVGKPWACHNGYLRSRGEVLLFTDADTVHQPSSLKKMVSALLTETDGFLTIVTRLVLKKFWEYTLLFIFQAIALSVLGSRGSGGRHLANGQYMMFTREVYERIGGHERVAGAVIEDMELASAAAADGIRPVVYAVPELVAVRMYRDFSSLVEGFSKNLALGMRTIDVSAFVRTGALHVWVDGWLLLLLLAYFQPQDAYFLIPVALLGYVLYVLVSMYGEYRVSLKVTYHVLLFPILLRIYNFILLRSLYLVFVRREVSWKGVRYGT